jgi:hypothetical protein
MKVGNYDLEETTRLGHSLTEKANNINAALKFLKAWKTIKKPMQPIKKFYITV